MCVATFLLLLIHEMSPGQFYAKECCENQHCHPVICTEIQRTPFGWIWHGLSFQLKQLKDSPDGHCHICANATQPYCIYLPFGGET